MIDYDKLTATDVGREVIQTSPASNHARIGQIVDHWKGKVHVTFLPARQFAKSRFGQVHYQQVGEIVEHCSPDSLRFV